MAHTVNIANLTAQQRMLIECKYFSMAFFQHEGQKRTRISTDLARKESKEIETKHKCILQENRNNESDCVTSSSFYYKKISTSKSAKDFHCLFLSDALFKIT